MSRQCLLLYPSVVFGYLCVGVSVLLAGCMQEQLGVQHVVFNETASAHDIIDEVSVHWTPLVIVCVSICCICVCALPCLACFTNVRMHGDSGKGISFSLWPDDNITEDRLRGEALYTLTLPFLVVLLTRITLLVSSNDVVTTSVQALFLVGCVGRAMVADAKKSACFSAVPQNEGSEEVAVPQNEGSEEGATVGATTQEASSQGQGICHLIVQDFKQFRMPPPFLTSKLEAVDAVLDGIAIGAIIQAQEDPIWLARFELGFGEAPIIGPVAISCGLPALMGGGLLMSTIIQYQATDTRAAAAGLAGFGVTEELIWKHDDKYPTDKYILDFGRVIYEASIQLLLQGSGVMAAGIPIDEQPMLLISMIFSVLTGMKKLRDLWYGPDAWWVAVIPGAVLLLFALVRVIMAQTCPSFMWGITTSCVEMPEHLKPRK